MKSDFPNGLLTTHASMPESDAVLTRFQELIRQGGLAANEHTDPTEEQIEPQPVDSTVVENESAESVDTDISTETSDEPSSEGTPPEDGDESSLQTADETVQDEGLDTIGEQADPEDANPQNLDAVEADDS